jgi:NAD/NADP transhydrogenase alpha subunit
MEVHFSKVMGFIAVVLASVNIFGGFIVTKRMLSMFRKKDAGPAKGKAGAGDKGRAGA